MLSFLKKLIGLSTPPPLTRETIKGGTVIDVRTPAEFGAGSFPGSSNIPLDRIPNELDRIKEMPQPIITCCKSGTRSAMATRVLKKAGIEAVNASTWLQVTRLAK